jgi:hypothetical protein
MAQETLRRFAGGGVSVLVGTVDADGIPTCCRGIAIAMRDDFELLTVYIPAATGQETVANLATTRRVAVSCTHPLSHDSVQIKGLTRGVRLEEIGLPRHVSRSMAHWPAFAIDVSVEQVFDQTPGPKAGAAIS